MSTDNPDPHPHPGKDKRRPTWITVGYGLTAAWMLYVLSKTGGDMRHPFFDYLFIVPLAGWIAAAIMVRLLRRGGRGR